MLCAPVTSRNTVGLDLQPVLEPQLQLELSLPLGLSCPLEPEIELGPGP